MKLDLIIDGSPRRIELLHPSPACRFRLDDGPERVADVVAAAPNVYSALMDGRVYDAHLEQSEGCLIVTIDGHRFAVEVRDPRRWQPRGAGRGGEGVQTVKAPMPGKIVRVLVSPGDLVETGAGLVVVEAMKMQNEMKASRAGRVISVAVREGATVAAGEVLLTVE